MIVRCRQGPGSPLLIPFAMEVVNVSSLASFEPFWLLFGHDLSCPGGGHGGPVASRGPKYGQFVQRLPSPGDAVIHEVPIRPQNSARVEPPGS